MAPGSTADHPPVAGGFASAQARAVNSRRYAGRFAPSPTGLMHFGVARTSLAAWLDARANQGRIVLRIEDVDRPRVIAGARDALLRDLEWLGLEWDEGPGRPGPAAPYDQSERDAIYLAAIDRLEALGRVYPCTCSRREIALAASAPHGPQDEGPRYPEICRPPSGPQAGRPRALRLATFAEDLITHEDLIFGRCDQDVHAAVGDFVIRRADGLWAYQLAVVADDLAQDITRIVRGADLLGSTPRQLLLRKLLAPDAPPLETLHVPLVLGPDLKRLAKREGVAGIASRREAGEEAEAVVGALAASLGLVPPGTKIRAAELIPLWDPRRLSKEPVVLQDV